MGRDFFRPAWPVVGLSVTKFAQHAKNGPKLAVCGLLGEFCTGLTQECPVQGEFCTGLARKVASGESYGPVGTRKDAYLAVVVPGATRTEAGRTTASATYQPRTSSAREGEASHCLVPKEDTDTAATADAKRMRRSGSASSPRRGCFEGLYERKIAPA